MSKRQHNFNYAEQKGVTLVELLIALSLSFFIITLFLVFFSVTNQYQTDQKSILSKDEKINKIIHSVTDNLRRAGYWAFAFDNIGVGKNINPFMQKDTNLMVSADRQCVLYAYDLNQDGQIPPVGYQGGDERFGFRLKNNYLQIRPKNAQSFSCDDGFNQWITITNSQSIQFKHFQIHLITNDEVIENLGWIESPKLKKRLINIKFDAISANNNEPIISINRSVLIKNDQLIAGVMDVQNSIICHQLPSGHRLTLSVKKSQLTKHLANGDLQGACP